MHPNPLIIGLLNQHPTHGDVKMNVQNFIDCGLIEVRFDLFDGFAEYNADEISHLVNEIRNAFPSHSLMATIRLTRDGGLWPVERADQRTQCFEAIIKTGQFEWVDFEFEEPALMGLRDICLDYNAQILCSHHNFNQSYTESELSNLTKKIDVLGASAAKFALTFQSLDDESHLYNFIRNRQDDFVFAAFSMGALGEASRVVAPILGASGTYGFTGETPSAPGQWKISALVRFFRHYHEVSTLEEAKASVLNFLALEKNA